jgi:hypothetical protein
MNKEYSFYSNDFLGLNIDIENKEITYQQYIPF